MTIDGYATGLIVESHEGRPTKVEGNPDHPASLGAAGILEQASVLQLYDPHRARVPRAGRRRATLDAARAALAPAALSRRIGARGAGLHVLLEPTGSPLVAELIARVRAQYPDAAVSFYAPLASAAPLEAARTLFRAALVPQYDFSKADVVVSLSADFLAAGPFRLRHAADFATRRSHAPAARLYVAETQPSPTSTLADRRIALAPSLIGRAATALFDAVAAASGDNGSSLGSATPDLPPAARAWVEAVARDLAANRGRSIVIAGPEQAAAVHTITYVLNSALGNVGQTTWFTASPLIEPGEPSHDLGMIAAKIQTNTDTLVILDVNVCYGAPADLDLERRIRSVPNAFYLGAYDDETARSSAWHVPASHYLELWGDARAYDGTVSLVQPLIAPLYESLSTAEVLAALAGLGVANVHDLLTQSDAARGGAAWEDVLRRGVIPGSELPRVIPAAPMAAATDALRSIASTAAADSIDIAFVRSATVHDGRFANNVWLQELPDPITKLTWDNAALVSPAFAASAHIGTGDVIRLTLDARSIEVPALVVVGHADGAVSLPIGYGRSGAEAAARGVGVNANVLRTVREPFAATGLRLTFTGRQRALATTQSHWDIEGRSKEILAGGEPFDVPDSVRSGNHRRPLTLYEPNAPSSTGFGADQWAMTIDLDLCTGCSACVVACQAENNVPTVGRKGVLESREMHWLRIDRYVDEASPDRVETQPMLCQHCEKAPCEYVCPVNATVHSDDGLNEMVYNRCVGTRFCSNNCPYKVRRFNWFDYNDELAETVRMAKNPSVTVRQRGVMEKCTFCVQRIRRAQIDAEEAGEPRTGPVVTACQQACPTHAIVFGSLTDPTSDVVRLARDPRAFSALEDLGTVPRVRYLRRRNDGNERREAENAR
jgi:molybdopterin-containing oxidoreductase family iron-sulfur binding subunit